MGSVTTPSFRLRPCGQLEGRKGNRDTWKALTPRAIFPLSDPDTMISLRQVKPPEGQKDLEWALVESLDTLDPASAKALSEAVSTSRFLIEITAVHEVELQHELRLWSVETRQGPRKFPAKLDHWPRPLGHGAEQGWLMTDVSGDVYRIPPADELDEKSREVLWSFIA